MNPRDPMSRLRKANPVPMEGSPSRTGRRNIRRAGQALLALVGVLVVGVGAAWATSGVNPVASLFKENLKVVESDYGLDSFSILEPMTQEKFDALPRRTAMHLTMMGQARSLSRALENSPDKKGPLKLDNIEEVPVGISAIGEATASTGSEVTMLVVDEQICTAWRYGAGNCSSLESIREGFTVGGSPELSDDGLWRLNGMVTDEVETIVVDGTDIPPMPISDNVFEFRNMEPIDRRLIGLDEDGNEVFRTGAPMASWAGLG